MREAPFFERVILREEGLSRSEFPLSVPAVSAIESLCFHPGVTVLAGENGSGKSTILEAIAIAAGFSPEGGTKNFRTETTPQDRGLADRLTLVRNPGREKDGFFLRAESGYVAATYLNEIESPVRIQPKIGPAFFVKPNPICSSAIFTAVPMGSRSWTSSAIALSGRRTVSSSSTRSNPPSLPNGSWSSSR